MTQTVNTRERRKKVTRTDQQKISYYQGLPGVYVTVKDVIRHVQEDKKALWKQQSKQ